MVDIMDINSLIFVAFLLNSFCSTGGHDNISLLNQSIPIRTVAEVKNSATKPEARDFVINTFKAINLLSADPQFKQDDKKMISFLDSVVDFQWMLKSIVGSRIWRSMSEIDRTQTTLDYVKYLLRNNLTILTETHDSHLQIRRVSEYRGVGNSSKYVVEGVIVTADNGTVEAKFKLHYTQDQVLKFYDVVIAGASLLTSSRIEFRGYLIDNDIIGFKRKLQEG